MSIRTRLVPLAVAGALCLGLSACASGSGSSSQESAAPSSKAPASTSTGGASSAGASTPGPSGATSAGSSGGTSTASPSPTSVVASGPGQLRVCTTDGLRVTVRTDGGAAGSTYYRVVLRNTSGARCATSGYPGISLVGRGDGTQIGSPAEREAGPHGTVVLPRNGRAVALLRVVDAGNYDKATCRPRAADGIRVYPPDQTKAAFVPLRTTGCRAASVRLLSVQPLHAS